MDASIRSQQDPLMVEELPPTTDSRSPWYQTPWGIAYLLLLVVAAIAFFLVATSTSFAGFDKLAFLMIPGMALDALLLVPISIGIFRRRFWRIHRSRIADILLSLLLLAICIYVVCSAVFAACLVLS